MRYLGIAELEELSALLSSAETSDGTRLSCRFEAYSCKAAGADKKLLVQLLRRYGDAARAHRTTRGAPTSESGNESAWDDAAGCVSGEGTMNDSLESLMRSSHDSLLKTSQDPVIRAPQDSANEKDTDVKSSDFGKREAECAPGEGESTMTPPASKRRASLTEGTPRSVSFAPDVTDSPSKRSERTDAAAELPPGLSLKTLYYLVATMNQVFPDYDLVDIDPRCFVPQPDAHAAARAVDAALGSSGPARLWDVVTDTIGALEECLAYTFDTRPTRLSVLDETDDPFWERGYLYARIFVHVLTHRWSINYFFYNRRLKRVLLVAVHAVSVLGAPIDERPSQRSLTPMASQDLSGGP